VSTPTASELIVPDGVALERYEAPEVVLSRQDLDMIRRQVVVPSGVRPPSDVELDDFGRACMARRLDPFDRQIYFAPIGGRWTYFIGVHGRLTIALRTGQVDGMEGPLFCHRREGIERARPPDWDELWDDDAPPHAAKFVVYRKGWTRHPVGIARWSYYAKATPVWHDHPTLMLGYKAITRALNLVFPDQLPPDSGRDGDDAASTNQPATCAPTPTRPLQFPPNHDGPTRARSSTPTTSPAPSTSHRRSCWSACADWRSAKASSRRRRWTRSTLGWCAPGATSGTPPTPTRSRTDDVRRLAA
jgi:hypothetical protein